MALEPPEVREPFRPSFVHRVATRGLEGARGKGSAAHRFALLARRGAEELTVAERLERACPRAALPRVELPDGALSAASPIAALVLDDFLKTIMQKASVGLDSTTTYTRRFSSNRTGRGEGECQRGIFEVRRLGLVEETGHAADTGRFLPALIYRAREDLLDAALCSLGDHLRSSSSPGKSLERRKTVRGARARAEAETETVTPAQAPPSGSLSIQGSIGPLFKTVTGARACISCGADISHRRPQARTCKAACRMAASRERRAAAEDA